MATTGQVVDFECLESLVVSEIIDDLHVQHIFRKLVSKCHDVISLKQSITVKELGVLELAIKLQYFQLYKRKPEEFFLTDVTDVLENILPYVLKQITNTSVTTNNEDVLKLCAVLSALISSALKLLWSAKATDIVYLCSNQLIINVVMVLIKLTDEQYTSPVFHVSMKVICAVIDSLEINARVKIDVQSANNEAWTKLEDVLIYILRHANPDVTNRLLCHVFPKVYGVYEDRTSLLCKLEDVACSFYEENDGEMTESHCTGLVVLCWTVDNYLSTDDYKQSNPSYTSPNFWKIIQHGLVHKNPASRKRALYLLSRIVTWCRANPESSALFEGKYFQISCAPLWWENIIGLLESLEEKQVHIIKPLLGRMNSLVKSARENASHCHVSWILVIFRRMFQHESKYIKKWAVHTVLELDLKDFQCDLKMFKKFIIYQLFEALDDAALYSRCPDDPVASCSPLVPALKNFVHSCYLALPLTADKECFFEELMKHMHQISWCGVALLYVTYALAELPPTPILGSRALENLRELMVQAIRTQEVFLRGAIQCFAIEAAIKLIKKDEVTTDVFTRFLSAFKPEESFCRGTSQWQTVSLVLKDVVSESPVQDDAKLESALNFCYNSVNVLLNLQLNDGKSGDTLYVPNVQECKRIAMLLLLLADAGIVTCEHGNARHLMQDLHHLLSPVINTMSTAFSRPYLSANKVLNSFSLISCLMVHCKEIDDIGEAICLLLYPHIDSIMDAATMKLLSSKYMEEADIYVTFISNLLQFDKFRVTVQKHLSSMANRSKQMLGENASRSSCELVVGWKCLLLTIEGCQKANGNSRLDQEMFSTVASTIEDWLNRPSPSTHCSGKLGCVLISTFWNCLSHYLSLLKVLDVEKAKNVVEHARQELQCAPGLAIKSILTCLERPLSLVCERHPEQVSECLSACWNACMELKKNELFKPTLEVFVKVAFQPNMMEYIPSCLQKYAGLFCSQGEMSTGIFNILIVHYFEMWRQSPEFFYTLFDHHHILTSALIFGPVHKKNQRVNYDAANFISKQENLAVNTLMKSDHLDDATVRVYALTILWQLLPANEMHQKFAKLLVKDLIEKNRKMSCASTSHFHNSEVHRVKQRIWQAMLVMQPILPKNCCLELLEVACNILASTNQQPSVRYLQEWLIVRILLGHVDFLDCFKDFFLKSIEKRVGSVCSFLSVVVHVASCMPVKDLPNFISSWLPQVIRCCMLQNFNSRVYAQVALTKLWSICTQHEFKDVIDQFSVIKPSLQINESDGNTSKNIQKLLKDFYFFTFNAMQHYTLETIFYELPRLSSVVEEEWISPVLFEAARNRFNLSSGSVDIFNSDDALQTSKPGSWVLRAAEFREDESGTSETEVLNFQKKITPWKHVLPELMQDVETIKKRNGPVGELIVVASLIDRSPNLGGLCRTCEIFGVREYVLGSLKYVEDQQFRNLSVSAENWITTREVKPFYLKEYLMNKKQDGYSIIGLEQTADSKKLTDFVFQKKSVLLLGNEKEGLPAEFLNLLDACLEIPQTGVIRSLNVHVSGAICIWEYTRQQTAPHTQKS